MDMHKFQMFTGVAPPPGLEAVPKNRKVSFAADAKAPPPTRPAGVHVKALHAPQCQQVHGIQETQEPPSWAATGCLHCVQCGTKVPAKLMGIKGLRYCMHCGKEHPKSMLDIAIKDANTSALPSEEHARLLAQQQQAAMLQSLDFLTKLLANCSERLTPVAKSQRQEGFGGEQLLKPPGLWPAADSQGQRSVCQQNASPAYVYAGRSAQHSGSLV